MIPGVSNKAYVWMKIAKAHTPILRRVRLLKTEPEVPSYGAGRVLSASDANDLLRERVAQGVPTSAGKIGSNELEVLVKYEQAHHNPDEFFDAISRRGHELDLLHLACGVFPKEQAVVVDWADTYLASLSTLDLLGVWFNSGEKTIADKYAPSAMLVDIKGLEPFYHESPWTKELAGRRVVAVTPFAASVAQQWTSRAGAELFPLNPSVLPPFALRIVRAPFSAGLRPPSHASWQAALTHLKSEVAKEAFDMALIGAGAFSLPLCSFVREELGRSAVHLGGGLQLLFGIKGRRWKVQTPMISRLFNDSWIHPLPDETPRARWKIEGGAYW
jgi:hypothetical protein